MVGSYKWVTCAGVKWKIGIKIKIKIRLNKIAGVAIIGALVWPGSKFLWTIWEVRIGNK